MTVQKLIEAYHKAMDFVMQEPADVCSKCIHLKPIAEYDDDGECEQYCAHGVVACQEGIVEYFKKELDNDGN